MSLQFGQEIHNTKKTLYLFQCPASTYNHNIRTKLLIMSSIQIPQFNEVIRTVSTDSIYKKIIVQADKLYLIKPLGLQTLNPGLVVQLIHRNFDKTAMLRTTTCEARECFNETIWALNQFKLFAWVSVCYGFTKAKEFQEFNNEDLEFLQSIFSRKSTTFLKYHLKNLLKEEKRNREKWSQQQMDLLTTIIRQDQFTFKWSDISFQLFQKSQMTFFRTPQKCREKWFNHLDPEVNRQKWTAEEDLSLFASILRYGSKWAMISKLFNGSRTEHMIKNRYNSLMRKYQTRSNRLSTKKLIEKIHSDLFNKVDGVIPEEGNTYQQMALVNQIQEKSGDSAETCPKLISNNIEITDESSLQLEREARAKHLMKLRNFDLEQILFSQTTIEIQEPAKIFGEVELIEVEMFADLPRGDQYLSSLLF